MHREATAAEYVEWLFSYALSKGKQELLIRSGLTLPGAEQFSQDHEGAALPPVEHVINRLKVLSGLSPVRYTQEVRKVVKKTIRTVQLEADMAFQDKPEGSMVRIHIVFRGSL